MISEEVWEGICVFRDFYLCLDNDDTVLILYSRECRDSAAWISVACTDNGANCIEFPMLPLRDESFSERLGKVLHRMQIPQGRLIVVTLERHTLSHSRELRGALKDAGFSEFTIFRILSASPELFISAIRATPQVLTARNAWLLRHLKSTEFLKVETPSGSRLKVTLDNSRYRWISSRGRARPGGDIILPAGEIATYPASIEGTFIADFALHSNEVIDLDTRLQYCPVTLRILDSQVVDFTCECHEIREYVNKILFSSRNANRIGELGIGTNPAVTNPTIFNSHINERRVGIHLGIGQHNQGDHVTYECPTHLDLISRDGRLLLDSGVSIRLDCLPEESLCHPSDVMDEDVFAADDSASCCGFIDRVCGR